MKAGEGFDESIVEEELEDIQDTLESFHNPKKMYEMLNRKNHDIVNTFLGDGPGLPAGCSREKGKEKVTIKPV